MDDLYHENILDHAQEPRRFGRLSTPSHVGQAKNVSCGDSLSVDLQVDEHGVIQDIAWEGDGCAISLAAASLLAERAQGKQLSELQGVSFAELLEALGLDSLSPARIKCATLFLNALQNLQLRVEKEKLRV